MPKSETAPQALGRPPAEYNEAFGDILCAEIASCTDSLKSIVKRLQAECDAFPCIVTIYKWVRENESFTNQYTRAKQDQSDLLVDQMIEIADDDSMDENNSTGVARAKLKVETRKWIASKLKPKSYGDRLDISAKVDNQYSVSALFQSIVPQPSLLGCIPVDDAILPESNGGKGLMLLDTSAASLTSVK